MPDIDPVQYQKAQKFPFGLSDLCDIDAAELASLDWHVQSVIHLLHAACREEEQACLLQRARNQAEASCGCILPLHIAQQSTKRYV